MKAEIIAIGTELLLGQILNSNAQYLSRQCAAMGIDVYFQTVVGDNASRLKEAFRLAAGRADLVLCTGGLGPTQDDLTKDVLSEFLDRPLLVDRTSEEKITGSFRARGIQMVESNIRQAHLLEGGDSLPNDTGMAVGMGLTHEGTHFVVLPGPPKEMKPMFENYAMPWILSKLPDSSPLYSKMLKFAGIGESLLEHQLIDLIDGQTDPTIAPYAKEGEVTIRLSSKARSKEEAFRKIESVESEIRKRLGDHIYAEEDISLESALIALMQEKSVTLAAAESCTGGMVSDMITTVPGSSEVFKGGVVCYTDQVKQGLLNVPQSVLDTAGAVSEETALHLAEQLLQLMDTDLAVSITGVAGPAESEGKPVGLVYIGVAQRGADTAVHKLQLSGNREMVKLRASKNALYQLWSRVKQL